MKIKDLINNLKQYDENFDVMIGENIGYDIDITLFNTGDVIDDGEIVKTPTVSLW